MDKTAIGKMFIAQRNLLDQYILIEGLPKYPVDINSREGQKVIRAYIHRFTEELAEAYLSLDLANQQTEQNRVSATEYYKEYLIELADAWHFLLEILIYMGYDDEISLNQVFGTLPPQLHAMIKESNPLTTMLSIGGFYNYRENLNTEGFKHFIIQTPDRMGGMAKVSKEILDIQSMLLWDAVASLHLVGNELKNKDWAQKDKVTNQVNVQQKLSEFLINWGRYLSYAGLYESEMLTHYMEKNEINLQRIKNGY